MEVDFKSKENFKKEVEEYIRVHDSTILEAVVAYKEKYELDESYISRLIDKDLKEVLYFQCDTMRMMK